MDEFKLYLIDYNFPFLDVLEILKDVSSNTVENYLKDDQNVKDGISK